MMQLLVMDAETPRFAVAVLARAALEINAARHNVKQICLTFTPP